MGEEARKILHYHLAHPMSQTQQQQGTTLEACAPYFLHCLDVLVEDSPELHRVLGWQDDELLIAPLSDLSECAAIHPRHCKPVLRPFSQLCEPLSDGTVPLLSIMKLALPNAEGWGPIRKTSEGEFYVHARIGNQHVKCWITDEWDVQLYGWGSYEPFVKNQAAILDYLRSQHFAVGLEALQYIAKSASRPTKEEGGPAL